MKNSIRALSAIIFMAASQSWAALTWSPAYSVERFWIGDSLTGSHYVVAVKIKETPSGCAAVSTNEGYQTFTYWGTSPHTVTAQAMLAQFAYADAQGRKISIEYDDANCNTSMGWYMRGVKVLPE